MFILHRCGRGSFYWSTEETDKCASQCFPCSYLRLKAYLIIFFWRFHYHRKYAAATGNKGTVCSVRQSLLCCDIHGTLAIAIWKQCQVKVKRFCCLGVRFSQRENGVQFPGRARDFVFCTSPGGDRLPDAYRGKMAETRNWPVNPPNAEFKNTWRYPSTCSRVFIARCSIRSSDCLMLGVSPSHKVHKMNA